MEPKDKRDLIIVATMWLAKALPVIALIILVLWGIDKGAEWLKREKGIDVEYYIARMDWIVNGGKEPEPEPVPSDEGAIE